MRFRVLLTATIVVVVVAAVLHRISGIGFALIAMPMLIVLQGPVAGLQLGLVLGLFVSMIALATSWRALNWRTALLLSAPSLVTVPLGAWLSSLISPPALIIFIGTSLVLLLALTIAVKPSEPVRASLPLTFTGGALAGLVHVMSGLSAPVLTAYAIRTRWPQPAFVATAQVVFIVLNAASLITYQTPLSELRAGSLLLPALAVGVFTGAWLSHGVTPTVARRLSIAIALIAASVTIVKGISGLD